MKINLFIISFLFSLASSSDFTFKDLPIQEDGRIKPLDTYANNQLLRIYGKRTFKEENGDKVFAIKWMKELFVNTNEEMNKAVFNIRNPEVAYSIGLDKNEKHKYSFIQIINGFKENQDLLESLSINEDERHSLVEKQIIEIYQNVILFDEIAHSMYCFLPIITIEDKVIAEYLDVKEGSKVSYSFFMRNIEKFKVLLENLLETEEKDWTNSHVELSSIAIHLQNLTQYHYAQRLKIIPPFDSMSNDRWLAPWELMDGRPLNEYHHNILVSYEGLILALSNNEQNKANDFSHDVISIIEGYDESFNSHLLLKETAYNKKNIFLYSLIFYVLSFLLAGISWMYKPKLFRKISFGFLISGLIMHAYGLSVRMVIMQRPPVSTLYESILFVSFILVLFAIIFEFMRKDTIGILIATIGGSILHFVGFKYAAEGDTLGMLVAVLNSNFWLATHVTTITIGYGVSLVAGLMGHIYLIFAFLRPHNKDELNKIFNNMYGLTLMGLFFTMFGTILGGIWADQSWGRFWGWDPKENGALLIVLWHLMMLHLRISGMVKPLGYAFGLSLVNIVVVLAWFGVNLLNVGLHSYGFTDNVATNLFIFIFIELSFTSTFYYLVKRNKNI
ncbi:MAG: hypothetical protein CMD65_00090 [Gammaproteobacteria bacterium]|nr:hypothetical protein [Gammaproteobacteria bacterium]